MDEYSIAKLKTDLIKNHEGTLEHIAHFGDFYDAILKAMPDGAIRDVAIRSAWLSLTISGNKDVLVQAIRALRIRGFESHASPPQAGKPDYMATYDHQNGPSVFLNFSSTVCKREKIGTRMVEEDVYQVVCDE